MRGSVARRLVAALAEPVTVLGTELFVSCSVGVAMYPGDGTDIDTLLMNADTAMYRAKEAGRGGFQFYDRSMNASARARLLMETLLRRALERNEFVLHYQPRVDLASGRIVGAEALIRWQHPERGLLPPKEFIPLAEEAHLVIPIGEWVIGAVCRQIAAWQAAGLRPIPVAVNLAAPHLRERALPELVERVLREHALPSSLLEIEVTESILMHDPELSLANARRLSRARRRAVDRRLRHRLLVAELPEAAADRLAEDRPVVRARHRHRPRRRGDHHRHHRHGAQPEAARRCRRRRDRSPARLPEGAWLRRVPGLPVRPPGRRGRVRALDDAGAARARRSALAASALA